MNTVLDIKNLSYSYHSLSGETMAIRDLSFHVTESEFVAVVGPSGCGKSTLLSLIAGLLQPDSGSIDTHSSQNIGYMLQKDHLLEWRSAYQNATLGFDIKGKHSDMDYLYVNRLLENYGLIRFKNARPSELSGGMRQRIALIRTLVMQPDLLLLDEPFSALDYQTRLEVSDDIWEIIKKEKKTAILITHDIAEAISMADRILILSKRPATLIKELPIHLTTNGEKTPFLARHSPEFQDYFQKIWEELNHGN